jgi:hypothetical protein
MVKYLSFHNSSLALKYLFFKKCKWQGHKCDDKPPMLLLSNNLYSSFNYGPFFFDYVDYISFKGICNFSFSLFLKLLLLLLFSG